jgi:putative transposase
MRPPRAFVDGLYHLGSHGSDTRHLFLSDEDRALFLERLERTLERFDLPLVEYALLGNHYHLVVSTPDARVSIALQQLHSWYSRRHNLVHGRSAHLFRAHFFAREITGDEDLLVVSRYLAYNAVAAGLAAHPFAWRWSSCAEHAGLRTSALTLDSRPLQAALGEGTRWRERYGAFIEQDLSVAGVAELGMELAGLEPATSWVRSASGWGP